MTSHVDLTNCDIEPIHIPGQVQHHGFLLAIDATYTVCYLSENITAFIADAGPALLGKNIEAFEEIAATDDAPGTIRQLITLARKNNSFDQLNPYPVTLPAGKYYLIISSSNDRYLLEFEPIVSDIDVDVQRMIGRSVSEMLADKNLQNLLNNSAKQVKNIIGYDRVMVYRFGPDGHGEVIAEEKEAHLEPFLGLHYPASDIPKQARELYKRNLTRIIADVNVASSPILAISQEAGPLDLTCSHLRAVSPMHIQYLKNMGVASSFSISLLYKGELWGLIACHNYSPRFIDFKARESSKLIGQILSSALEFRQDEEDQQLQDTLFHNVERLSKFMLQSNSIEDALTKREVNLLDVTFATGVALSYENNIITAGATPALTDIEQLVKWLQEKVSENIFFTDSLDTHYPDAEKLHAGASGILALTLSKEMGEYVIWFKPEQLQEITWAGNPDKPVETDASGLLVLSPRKSFDAWSETVSGKSAPWRGAEIKAAMRLKEEITYAINQKASAIRLLNEKLKQAYEELDTFSFTISHDLKNPLSVIKSYSQLLSRDASLKPESQKMLERIVNRADRMSYMINEVLEYSRIGRSEIAYNEVEVGTIIRDIVKDITMVYDITDLELNIGDTPPVKGDPLMVAQVFANLLSNAVKYSSKATPQRVSIDGRLTDTGVLYCVRDNGLGIDINQLPLIFDLFNRASNVQDIEGSGVGLAIVKRIVEKHRGKIWVDSEPGKGSSFYVEFGR